MYGHDLSHHQTDKIFREVLANPAVDFVILKASEGKTYVDPTFIDRAKAVQASGKLLGAYHFARFENNNFNEEWDRFKDTLSRVGVDDASKCRVFLDVEDKSISHLDKTARWLARARQEFPNAGLYCSLSVAKGSLNAVAKEFPVWIAHYNSNDTGGCIHYDGEIMTQYKSSPIDTDVTDDRVLNRDNWYAKTDSQMMLLSEDEKEMIAAYRNVRETYFGYRI